MLWKFSGAVDRVAYVVATSSDRGFRGAIRVGVVGLPKDRVIVPKAQACLPYFSRSLSSKARRGAMMLRYLVGQEADVIAGNYGVSIVRFPTGLSGAHAVKFVLDPGVPRPEGSPVHSRVIE